MIREIESLDLDDGNIESCLFSRIDVTKWNKIMVHIFVFVLSYYSHFVCDIQLLDLRIYADNTDVMNFSPVVIAENEQ